MRELGVRCANLALGARIPLFFYFPVLFLFTFFEVGFDAGAAVLHAAGQLSRDGLGEEKPRPALLSS